MTTPARPTTISDVDRAVLGRAGLTGIMAATDPSDEYVYQPVNTWHPVVGLWLLRHRTGTRISLDALTDFICQHFVGDLRNARFAYDGQLRRLAEAGWINRGPGHLIVLRSLEDAPNSPADDHPTVPPAPDQLGLFDA